MKFITKLVTEEINYKYSRIYVPFIVYSEILKKNLVIPSGFICDFESVPVVKGTSKRGGVIHDYLCRKDSVPVVDKKTAADVYYEAMESRDKLQDKGTEKSAIYLWFARHIKYYVVRIAPGYFHKHGVFDELF